MNTATKKQPLWVKLGKKRRGEDQKEVKIRREGQ